VNPLFVRTCVRVCIRVHHLFILLPPPAHPSATHQAAAATPRSLGPPSSLRSCTPPQAVAPAASGSWTASPPPRTQAPARYPLPRPPSSQATPMPDPPSCRCPAGNSVRQLRSYSIPFCLDGLTNYCFDLSPFRSAAFVSHVPFFVKSRSACTLRLFL
jgi:hypothetical protein